MPNEIAQLCFGCMEPLNEQAPCPYCGYDAGEGYDKQCLKPGTKISDGRYLIGKSLRKNGEGILYIGFDLRMQERCWIKEYFPHTLSRRYFATGDVAPLMGCEAQFKALSSDFVDVCNEVKRLGVTERVIPIRDMACANNTVYAIYAYLDVISFDDYLLQNAGKLPLQKARELLLPFCHMISGIHDHGFIHRGISPYTVYIDKEETLYLWDFSLGATRTANAELEAELFNGFCAPEQYSASGWQGPWTDVYAIAALFYRTISGFVPPKATLVGADRPRATLEDLVLDMPANISDAVEEAMTLSTEDRTQTVYAFTAKLIETEVSNTAVYDTVKTRQLNRRRQKRRENARGFKYVVLTLLFTVIFLFGGLWLLVNIYFPQLISPESSKPRSYTESVSESSSQPESVSAPSVSESSVAADAKLPNFIGEKLSVIEARHAGRYQFSVKEEFNDEFEAGVVYDQSPKANTLMPNKGTVIVYVSKGPELIEMPALVGLPYEDALRILGDYNLSCVRTERYSAGAEVGSVVGTSPAAGDKFDAKKEVITVYVMPEDNISDASITSKEESKEGR